ncbi:hypothetical protein L228DRAFT_277365 [Xylona heveae TC161]|uniref:Uncharacterized protein n=1 Tax=Xylona heveae (strain CBS 132557 / TC161) TaxID=1328760 RepID=A0A165GBD3_XYLHT|nr:hypothetical protein L228DRAFT_277365 [Xylona heveae TC161]KZF21985.1 hypothetical protein L228DRAFT_277365 [Xylona heveae TC161]
MLALSFLTLYMGNNMQSYHESMPSSSPSPSSSTSTFAYDQVPLVDEEHGLEEKNHDDLIRSLKSRPNSVQDICRRFLETPKTLIIAAILATATLVTVVVTSFTVHTPGSYVHMHTIPQKNALQPDYIDSFGGPLELGGTRRCGSYPSEAEALGCVFDLMNYGWTAPECYYESLSTAGLSEGPYKFYLDSNLTVEIPQEVAMTGRVVDVYTTHHYHTEHCKWSQAILAMAKKDDNVLIPQVIAQQNHTKHCLKYVENSEKTPSEKINTWTRVVYNSCIKLSEADVLLVD